MAIARLQNLVKQCQNLGISFVDDVDVPTLKAYDLILDGLLGTCPGPGALMALAIYICE
jgi:NAD(P)H-hydrate repair Nnr-like enzyme with NAD(P)H-hydrate epimerase domain